MAFFLIFCEKNWALQVTGSQNYGLFLIMGATRTVSVMRKRG